MKYKCIAKCFVEDALIMKPGDIVVMEGNQFYNITTGVDHHNISDPDRLKDCLEAITNEVPNANYYSPKTDADRFEDITKSMSSIFRKKNHEVISTLDELDAFGFFKKNGNVKISIDADGLMLTDFTADFDNPVVYLDDYIYRELSDIMGELKISFDNKSNPDSDWKD